MAPPRIQRDTIFPRPMSLADGRSLAELARPCRRSHGEALSSHSFPVSRAVAVDSPALSATTASGRCGDSRCCSFFSDCAGRLVISHEVVALCSRDFVCHRRSGACQGSCRLSYALLRFSVEGWRAAFLTVSRSGFSVTTAIGAQLRVGPDQRRGCLSLAS